VADITLASEPASVPAARRFVRDFLAAEGVDSAIVLPAVLLTSEVVTNVILHARTDLVVTATLDGNRARVAVRDGEVTPPRRRPAPPDSADGRGLLLVEALATSWGVLPYGGGKAVWFEL